MNAKNATIGPLMEQLVQLVTDVSSIKEKMNLLENAFGSLGVALAGRKKYKRRVTTEDEPVIIETRSPTGRLREPYTRGPYKKTSVVAASTSVNAYLRHLTTNDPERIKILKIRERKGHIAASEYVHKRFPDRAAFQKYRLKAAAKPAAQKAARADSELREKFKAALATLTAAEQKKATWKKRTGGTQFALNWINNGRSNGASHQAEA